MEDFTVEDNIELVKEAIKISEQLKDWYSKLPYSKICDILK